MGLGIGEYCERCGTQICYGPLPFTLKEEGDKYDLCGECAKIVAFDKRLERDRLDN